MKTTSKFFALILIISLFAVSFAGCGQDQKLKTTPIDTGIGLTITIPSDMLKDNSVSDDHNVYFYNEYCIFGVGKDTFAEFEALGIYAKYWTINDYAELIIGLHDQVTSFEEESSGNLSTTFEGNYAGTALSTYMTIRQSSNSFWLISFGCATEDFTTYLPLFKEWASSIKID